MSLIVDLGLNRSPFARRHFVTATEGTEAFTIRTEYHAEKLEDHTAEEKRAFLGCIYLSSVYVHIQKTTLFDTSNKLIVFRIHR